MSDPNNSFSAAGSNTSGQKGSILFLAVVCAFVRTGLLIIAAISLGASARFLFPEMFVITGSPLVLLAVVGVDTLAIAYAALKFHARSKAAR